MIGDGWFQIDLIQSEGEIVEENDEEKQKIEIKNDDHIKLLHIETTKSNNLNKYFLTSTINEKFKSLNYRSSFGPFFFFFVCGQGRIIR